MNADPQRILVVDDDDAVRTCLLSILLDSAPHVVSMGARDGFEAVAALASAPFDVVITDLVMPRMDGYDLIRWVRHNRPEVPVILLNGDPRLEAHAAALALGAARCLDKPVTMATLQGAVVDALASTAVRRGAVPWRIDSPHVSALATAVSEVDAVASLASAKGYLVAHASTYLPIAWMRGEEPKTSVALRGALWRVRNGHLQNGARTLELRNARVLRFTEHGHDVAAFQLRGSFDVLIALVGDEGELDISVASGRLDRIGVRLAGAASVDDAAHTQPPPKSTISRLTWAPTPESLTHALEAIAAGDVPWRT